MEPIRSSTQRGHAVLYYICIFFLSVTAVAKLWGSWSKLPILYKRDSLLYLDLQHVFWLSAGYEIIVVCILALSKNRLVKAMVISITGAQFLLYRIFKSLLNDPTPCPCLGNVPHSLGLSDAFVSQFLLFVSSFFVFAGVVDLVKSKKGVDQRTADEFSFKLPQN